MSTTIPNTTVPNTTVPGTISGTAIPLGRILAAETFKLRSLRTHRLWVLGAAAFLVLCAGGLAVLTGRGSAEWNPQPVALPLEYFAYVMMVVGVLTVTGDNTAGTAAVTGSLVPRRGRVAYAKYLVAAGLAAVAALPVGVLVVLAAWLGSGVGADVAFSDEALAVALSGILAVPVAAVLGVAVGILLRFTTLAVSLLMAWSFLAETFLVFVAPVQPVAFLPFKTFGGSRLLLGQLGPWVGLAVFVLWTAALVALAVAADARRDAPVV